MSVYKHNRTGRWVAQVSERGRKRQIGTFATKREALEALRAEAAREIRPTMTVTAWRERWLANPDWKQSTRQHNAERTIAFEREHGKRQMNAVDRRVARDWVLRYPSTHGALSAMFGAAVYDDVLEINPFSKLVKKKTARRDIRADWLGERELRGLELAAVEVHGPVYGSSMAAMIRFAAETGVRPGELFVVEDRDLDPERGALYVRRAADSKTRTIGLPKNGQEREIVLSRRAAEAADSALRHGDNPRIFSSPRGRQFWLPSLSGAWRPVAAAAGRAGMDFYELRHFCATRLLERGVPDWQVAVQLGHTDGGELVRKVYGHPSERLARDAVRRALDEGDVA